MKMFLNCRYFTQVVIKIYLFGHLAEFFVDSLDCVIFKMINSLPLNKQNCLS